jgi:SAM-dependent methyltransferase
VTAAGYASPLAFYGAALRGAVTGESHALHGVDPAGTRPTIRLAVSDWCGGLLPGDTSMLSRCHGPTLDVGCGTGRLTEALHERGVPALGIDISAVSVRLARQRGVAAELTCVLTGDLPSDQWRHVLLADGNIGIGGDPARLLARCARLLIDAGDIIAELERPGRRSWSGPIALRWRNDLSAPFAWATVAVDDIDTIAVEAGLHVAEVWTEARRWFAHLIRR